MSFDPSKTNDDGIAISLRGVCKSFRSYAKPIHRLWEALSGNPRHKLVQVINSIDLEVEAGHTVAIVGRNGSGKSTLLKLIAGTLLPSQGTISVQGTVAALLELGSGFNPELSGRENIQINAAIHGLNKKQVAELLPAIAEYSELDDYLDRPVNTYSSGMVARLAFASAIHVQRDILIVDETLSVGDAMFQRKCMATIEAIQESGRTILFVSHSVETVKALCDRAVLLEKGGVQMTGTPTEVLQEYARISSASPRWISPTNRQNPGAAPVNIESPKEKKPPVELPKDLLVPLDFMEVKDDKTEYGSGDAEILNVEVVNPHGKPMHAVISGQHATLRYRVRFDRDVEDPVYGMMLRTVHGIKVYSVNSKWLQTDVSQAKAGDHVTVQFSLHVRLAPGSYFITVGCSDFSDGKKTFLHRRFDAMSLHVLPAERFSGIANLEADLTIHHASQECRAA